MDSNKHLLVVLILISAVTVGNASKNSTGIANNHYNMEKELAPSEAAKKALESLQEDTLSNIHRFENMVSEIVSQLSNNSSLSTDNVDLSVREFEFGNARSSEQATNTIDFDKSTKSRIKIPIKKILQLPQAKSVSKLTVVTAWWKNAETLPSPGANAILPKKGAVLSVSYFFNNVEKNSEKQSLPINFYVDLEGDVTYIESLSSNERLRSVDRACAWLDLPSNTWKKSGCNAIFNGKGVTCECNHTTTFVTLLLLDTVAMPQELNATALAFETSSIIFLLLTILFLCVARQGAGISSTFAPKATGMNANRTNSQVSLCASLLAMHLVIVWSEQARQNDQGCVACTVFSHYFLLASAFWSLCEGLGIFVKMFPALTMVIQYRTLTIIQSVVGWGVPFAIVIATAAYGIPRDVYMDETNAYKELKNTSFGLHNPSNITTPRYEECWLSKTNSTVWAALGPLIFIVTANLVTLCYVTKEVITMNRKHPVRQLELSDSQSSGSRRFSIRRGTSLSRAQQTVSEITTNGTSVPTEFEIKRRRRIRYLISIIRSFGILMPILALPWILAMLSNIPSISVALSAAHTVVNGLQGFQIFLLYCVVNKRDWKIVKRKWRNSELTHFFGNYNVRRTSIASTAGRVVYEPKKHASKVDSNGNNFLGAGWIGGIPTNQYDTLSSCRSSSGTIFSTQSLQRSRKSPVKKSGWWWTK